MIKKSFLSLKSYCEREQFKGWDPYDGLNSNVFNAIPFANKSSLLRMLVIQGFKRLPINLRKPLGVPKMYNAKGLGLFLTGYCNLYNIVEQNSELEPLLGCAKELRTYIVEFAGLLLGMQSKGYRGACWGYTFDWQSKAFFLPKNTPTVVATSFVVEALLNAYEITKDENYLSEALSSADFILHELNRIPKADGCFMFSYSPLDTRAVYNATLLGTKTLALIYKYTKNHEYKSAAYLSAKAVCAEQNADGSFPHSDQVRNLWRDNFHTGFKLESLSIYQDYCEDTSFSENIERGFRYWINNYFIKDKGIAKYYDNSSEDDLIDLHCVAQAIPTICKLNKINTETVDLMNSIIVWAIENMQSPDGYFYFQKRGASINKIPYMRWPNAWMFYGMSYFIKSCSNKHLW